MMRTDTVKERSVRRTRTITALVVAAGLLLSAAPLAQAEERTCRGSLGAITVDNLRVPDGATCTLDGTKVKGTIKVESRATLVADGIRVIGNVQAEDAARVVVRAGSTVGGSVQIVQGGSARIARTTIEGDILFDEQRRPLAALRSTVGGNIQVFQNTGGVEISRNAWTGTSSARRTSPRRRAAGTSSTAARRISARPCEALPRLNPVPGRQPFSIASTSTAHHAGMSSTTRPQTRVPSRNAGSSTHVAPALMRSSAIPVDPVAR